MIHPTTVPPGKGVSVGRYVPAPGGGSGLRILCDAPELERHIGRPWFRAYAAERLDIPGSSFGGTGAPSGPATVGHDLLARHACVCGSTGSGKTRLALHLLAEQIKAGCSVVMLDPKAETVRHLTQLAHTSGVAPEQVTVLSPFLAGAGAPGWNPLDASASGVPPAQAAADVVSVLAKSTSSWGPRMQDLLTNALIVVASHGLSLFELARLLQRDDYREGLLRRPLPRPEGTAGGGASDAVALDAVVLDTVAFGEARDYFQQEFAAWGKSERAAATAPVLNKFRELLRSPFLRSLLCARRTTLDLSGLWRRPGLVLVHLDSAALGDEGARLLGGLLAHQLLRTAMRADGPVPVVLALDEMGVSEEFVGGAAARILAIARSRNLRLLVACQHLAQLSDQLKAALLANTALQAFFRLGYADARLVAASLAARTGERVSSIAADVAKRDAGGVPEAWADVRHTLRDGRGDPLTLSPAAAQAFADLARAREWGADGAAQVKGLQRLARVSGIERVYVHAPDTRGPAEMGRYLRGLKPGDYRLEGRAPVRLVVTFPRPRLSVVARETEAERGQRWLRTLSELPVRRAVLRLAPGDGAATGQIGVVQVVDVPDPVPSPGFERFLPAAVAHGGQSAREIEGALAWRQGEVERVANGMGRPAGKTLPAAESSGRRITERPCVESRSSRDKAVGAAEAQEDEQRPPPASTALGMIAEDGSLA